MAPDWKCKNHPTDRSFKEDLSIDTTFDPPYISWDTPFKMFIIYLFNKYYVFIFISHC